MLYICFVIWSRWDWKDQLHTYIVMLHVHTNDTQACEKTVCNAAIQPYYPTLLLVVFYKVDQQPDRLG